MVNIYVGNLSYQVEEQELEALFNQYGSVERVTVIKDRDTGSSKGFAFVEMQDTNEGEAAIESLNDTEFRGRQLKVNKARPRAERPRRASRW